jgi:two-component system invasion response regulator UvrY
MRKINLLIADDHRLVRETWSSILSADERFKVVGVCGTVTEAIAIAAEENPDIILMDVNIPPTNGFEATKQLSEVCNSFVIGVSMHSQPSYARRMLLSGAKGYVTKNSSKEEMFEAIMNVYKGQKYLCEEIKKIIVEQEEMGITKEGNLNSLSEREVDIVNCIREGLSSREMADRLKISVKTVEVHRHNILKKLGVKNATSLINLINNSSTHI